MLAEFFSSYWGKMIAAAGMALLPVVELRGAIPFGMSLGLSVQSAFLAGLIGNMIPIPFIVLLIRRIFSWLRVQPKWGSIINRLEKKAHIQGRLVTKYRFWGLCLLVAIPLPGTGAWTGALVAGLLRMRLKEALPAIFLGVILAGLLVALATCGIITVIQN